MAKRRSKPRKVQPPKDRRPLTEGLELAARSALELEERELAGGDRFRGVAPRFQAPFGPWLCEPTAKERDSACRIAGAAFFRSVSQARERARLDGLRRVTPERRATFLDVLANVLDAHREPLVAVAARETGLLRLHLRPEFDRMTTTLRLFAAMLREGSWVRAAIDTTASTLGTRGQDVRRMLRPLGPVAVYPPSNFPFAYGVAGGDVASAIAAGCPVVVKAHPAHPILSTLLASAVHDARVSAQLHRGWHSVLLCTPASADEVGAELARQPNIQAIGFTGSPQGGMALERIARERSDTNTTPIPVFAEMGSTNPVIVYPRALRSRGAAIAMDLARSIRMRNAQQCTCSSVIVLPGTENPEPFACLLATLLAARRPQPMLSPRVIAGYERATSRALETPGVSRVVVPERPCLPGHVAPLVMHTTFDALESRDLWQHEMFGPAVLVIGGAWDGKDGPWGDAARVLMRLGGSLTITTIADANDARRVREDLRHFASDAGRIIHNGVPTGVRVCHAMVHGGPFPATNAPHTTAVGPMAIERWCRPVCYQNCPDELLPEELQDANPRGIMRIVDGAWTREPIVRTKTNR